MRPSHKFRVVIVEDSHVFARRMQEALGEIPHLEIVGAGHRPPRLGAFLCGSRIPARSHWCDLRTSRRSRSDAFPRFAACGVSPLDPLTYAAVSLGLLMATLAASYIPTLRAFGVNPIDALCGIDVVALSIRVRCRDENPAC
jgi:hypothetical protein